MSDPSRPQQQQPPKHLKRLSLSSGALSSNTSTLLSPAIGDPTSFPESASASSVLTFSDQVRRSPAASDPESFPPKESPSISSFRSSLTSSGEIRIPLSPSPSSPSLVSSRPGVMSSPPPQLTSVPNSPSVSGGRMCYIKRLDGEELSDSNAQRWSFPGRPSPSRSSTLAVSPSDSRGGARGKSPVGYNGNSRRSVSEDKPRSSSASQNLPISAFEELALHLAKKERKVSELREELKQQESELKELKQKWQSIVTRSLSKLDSPASTPSSFHNNSPSASFSPKSTADDVRSPISPSPSSRRATRESPLKRHSISLGGLGTGPQSPFIDDGSDVASPVNNERVRDAKRWMGGIALKLIENLATPPTPPSASSNDAGTNPGSSTLPAVPEASEEERESPVSPLSKPNGDKLNRSEDQDDESKRTSTSSSTTGSTSMTEFGFQHERYGSDISIPTTDEGTIASLEDGSKSSHHRKRSTLDSIFGSGVTSLSKRWGELQNSESFKTSKRATLTFVSDLESTLLENLTVPANPHSPSSASASPTATISSGQGQRRRKVSLKAATAASEPQSTSELNDDWTHWDGLWAPQEDDSPTQSQQTSSNPDSPAVARKPMRLKKAGIGANIIDDDDSSSPSTLQEPLKATTSPTIPKTKSVLQSKHPSTTPPLIKPTTNDDDDWADW